MIASEEKSEVAAEDLLRILAANSAAEGSDLDVLVSVTPPKGEKRTPVDMVCVVDVSGSMSTEAEVTSQGGGQERHGLTLLDVVKHAVKTVCNILDDEDRLAVVSYSSNAKTEIGLTKMDGVGKKRLIKVTEGLHVQGMTNLWDGLREGMDLLRKGKKKKSGKGRASAVLLLTDGMPNVNPPRGELEMLKRYRDQHQMDCTVSTFGFGYRLDSKLLDGLAVEGNGSYCFIPDASFVGTVFIHAASNILSTWANNATVSLELMNGASITEIPGSHPTTTASWGSQLQIGSLLYGQTRDIVVRLSLGEGEGGGGDGKPYLSASVKLLTVSGEEMTSTAEGSVREGEGDGVTLVAVQRTRSLLVDVLQAALKLSSLNDFRAAKEQIKALAKEMTDANLQTPLAKALLEDVSGQGTEAISTTAFFNKWGKHYLPSLIRAHQLQQCNNFKDPGVQLYGGELFQSIRDVADSIFLALPPPKPSAPVSRSSSSAPRMKLSNMNAYHYSGNPCFAKGSVKMADGSLKDVRFIQKGDRVFCPDDRAIASTATVVCVVKTMCENGKNLLANFQGQGGDLLVTPWHPVNISGCWRFPADISVMKEHLCEAVYSFVLNNGHVMLINGIQCVTFGHQLRGNVVEHPYFGSEKIIEDLRMMVGWGNGFIELYPGCTVRDPKTGLVAGLIGGHGGNSVSQKHSREPFVGEVDLMDVSC